MATTLFLWMRVPSLSARYQTAVIISGLVTFIAAYHYFRIFNSWTEAYAYTLGKDDPQITGVPFNDAYRYMDWLLTVPMLLMEIVLVMELSGEEASQKCVSLGYIVYELLVGLAAATAAETDPKVRDLVFKAQWVTVLSWLTYPVVYIFPMLGFAGAQAVVNIQV